MMSGTLQRIGAWARRWSLRHNAVVITSSRAANDPNIWYTTSIGNNISMRLLPNGSNQLINKLA
jgi:hypothetical protein